MKRFVITFNMGNQEIEMHSMNEWLTMLAAWREELTEQFEDDEDYVHKMDVDEVIEHMWGDEMFFKEFSV